MNIRTHKSRGWDRWLILAVAVLFAVAVGEVPATVTTVAWYRGGEADSGATAGGAVTPVMEDSSGNNLDIDLLLSNNWTTDTPPADRLTLGASSFSYFTSGGAYRTLPGNVTAATDNVGIEAWVKPYYGSQVGIIAQNGGLDASAAGFGLIQNGTVLSGHVPGLAFVGATPVSTTDWMHIAFVRNGGVYQWYVNGSLEASLAAGMNPYLADSTFALGLDPYLPGGGAFYIGRLDEVRVFTFNLGEFSVSDLNIALPEPGTAGLMLLGLVVWRGWRMRK